MKESTYSGGMQKGDLPRGLGPWISLFSLPMLCPDDDCPNPISSSLYFTVFYHTLTIDFHSHETIPVRRKAKPLLRQL